MPEIPEANYSPPWAEDTRPDLPVDADERETLTSFLDWHRNTLALKCAGVDRARLSDQSVPPSGLSLHGLLRHMAGVERWWFRLKFGQEDVPMLYYSDDDPNQDFETLDGDVDDVLEVWRAECARSREVVARTASLDDTGGLSRKGVPFSLRFVIVTMIAEYARHNGHADLLREQIDGQTGY